MHSALTPTADAMPRMRAAPPVRGILAATALFVFAVPFTAYARLILVHFYLRGSFLLDSGLLAALIWHSDDRLSLPASLGGESFFAIHIAPVLVALGWLSRALPLTMPQFFATFIGTCHGLLALAVFWLLVEGYAMRRGAALAVAALAALGFSFGGLAVAIALYPHFETLEAASLLLFLVALVLHRFRVAAAWFVLALATREDAGLHAALLLTVVLAANAIRGVAWPARRAAIGFAAAGLAHGLAALALQHVCFPGHSSFVRVYLGTPPFAHLDAMLLAMRTAFIVRYRAYIALPAFGALIWAARARSPYPLLGFAACLPWTALHLLAASPFAGLLAGYYGFPFLLALAWPLLGALVERGGALRPQDRRAAVAGFGAILVLGAIPLGGAYNPGRLAVPAAFLVAPSRARQVATDAAVAAVIAARPQLGRLVVDNSVAALRPTDFARGEVASWAGAAAPDTVVMFAAGYDAARLRALSARAGLTEAYRVPGTQIVVQSRLDLQRVPAFGPLLRRVPGVP